MQRKILVAAAVLATACEPSIKTEEPTPVITARFDPSAAVPVVPTPNDLATNRATGLLAVTVPASATGADRAFYGYLNSLNGFPTSSGATTTFDGALNPSSISATSVKVYDVTNNFAAVTTTPVYADVDSETVKGSLSIAPPAGGWVPGHTYAVGLVGGADGLKGAAPGARSVVSSSTWAFLRLEKSLVTCTNLTSPDCQTATEIIPSPIKDNPAARLKDQTAKAIQLEQLRLKYKPTIDKMIADGVKREDIVLAWTFRIADFAQAVFDPAATPPKVPTPNDLAIDRATGLVKAPIDPAYSDAYKEFINDYLNTLDGFPVTATAQVGVTGGDVDPATVNDHTVLVIPLDGKPEFTGANIRWNSTSKTIDVNGPNGSWGKDRKIAIAVIGRRAVDVGEPVCAAPDEEDCVNAAVEQVGGKPLVASSVWALVRSASALVTCPGGDLTSPDCTKNINAAPLTVAQAISLEGLRRIYAPALAAVEELGFARDHVAILWTFRTVTLPEATFDPSASIIPFPNNVLRIPSPAKLNLPVPDGGSALQVGLITGLNTLDGFSVTAPIVSENSATRGAIDVGELDPAGFDAGTGFFRLNAGAAPRVKVCLNCASSRLSDGGMDGPQQLQFVPELPLDEQAPYGVYLTGDLKNVDGKRVVAAPTFALARLQNPLCTDAKSTVPVLSDAQACGVGGAPGLEALRAGHKPLLDALAAQGKPRKNVALAWAFTTQSTASVLSGAAMAVATGSLPTTVTLAPVPKAGVFPAQLPSTAVGDNVYIGTLTVPHALNGPGGVMTPPVAWTSRRVPYLLTIPSGTAPANGWPVVLFGHGLTGSRLTMLAIANALAAGGFAALAIDAVWHGDRNTCLGAGAAIRASGQPNATDDWACTGPGGTIPDPVAAQCDAASGRCVQRGGTPTACVSDLQCLTQGRGLCVSGNCEGADFVRASPGSPPAINSWNFLNLQNLFAARDNFRHYALDMTQLVRIVKANGFANATPAGPSLDMANIHYVGMSLGGFHGAMFSAVSPDVKNVVLNVPGSDQVDVLLTSPAFGAQRTGFLGSLAQQGITPGTPAFDQLMGLIRTIFDPADPQAFGYNAVNAAAPAGRRVFIQWIANDAVVPNSTTAKLIAASSWGAKTPIVKQVPAGMGPASLADRHGYLLNFRDVATTAAGQTEVVTFLNGGNP